MTSLSVTIVLFMLNGHFLLELLESFTIINRSIFFMQFKFITIVLNFSVSQLRHNFISTGFVC